MKHTCTSLLLSGAISFTLFSCSKTASSPSTPVATPVLTVITVAGSGNVGAANGTGTAASFYAPSGLALSSSGDLYVGDWLNNEVRKFNLSTLAVTTFAGSIVRGISNGPALSATFYGTANLTFDKAGNMFVCDEQNSQIREITTAGNVVTVAGTGVAGYHDGAANTATFNQPSGLVLDANGDIYVADNVNNVIRKITMSTGMVSTYAGTGVRGNNNGSLNAATFSSPYGMAIDGSGNLYVADISNNTIRKITVSTGMVSTFAGTGQAGLSNGTTTTASFNKPGGLTFDSKGNLFVSEFGNNTIRKIGTDGTVTTYAGSGAKGATDGLAANATFNSPNGLAFDSKGNLYVADENNNKLREVVLGSVTN